MASDATQFPSLVPKAVKRCITCKARRVKCDETKPSCNQCLRRRVTCGGYKKDIRFRPVERAPAPPAKSPPIAAPIEESEPRGTESTVHAAKDVLEDDELAGASASTPSLSFWPWMEEDVSNLPLLDFELSSLPWMDFSHLDANTASEGSHALDRIMEEAGTDFKHGIGDTPGSAENTNPDSFLHSAPVSPSLDVPTFPFFQNIELEADDRDEVESLFHKHTLNVLSMCDDTDKNPWRSLIWPMTTESKALYHAIAAMAFLQQSKSVPSMRERGLVHARKSTQQLAADLSNGEIQIDAALAATIALGFAESWDFQKSSTGRTHIQGARILLQQSMSQYATSQTSGEMSARLRFLANTWIYMDVLARLTSDCGPASNAEILSLLASADPPSKPEELDPLMGYATTLFPIIGRVADLITQIRTRYTRRNSPVIISKGIELRHLIEDWSPTIDLEQIASPTSNMVEAIQTAEAYRWSTLLLLQEAVPELPSLASYKELGQKTLVYLATIPTTSATLIAHIYPLMVAATEAVEEEDREFVRDRWKAMSKRMITGIVDHCEKIMEEVWRRRDKHFSEWLARNSPDPATFGVSPSSIAGRNGERNDTRSPTRKSTKHSDFPISIAFRKGVDPITRSGNIDYTVKGNLHWMEVMKEWELEGMLCWVSWIQRVADGVIVLLG
ncbi:hypothetical protein N0V90_002700 [Kalmusia sp. IMI 367209]|nr:hypothetical protein N0V90_002700 [Kalmusia sp. IMI 367209]